MERTKLEIVFTKQLGGGEKKRRRNSGENLEVMEEVGYSISDTILSPVYKRFNSSGPLITVFDPAEAVIVSTARVFVHNKVYTEKRRGEQFRAVFSIATCRPMEFRPH